MATNIASPETKKLPSNAAVRAILAYYVELCAELGLDPRTGKPLRKKIAHARKAAVHASEVPAAKL